MRVQAIIFAKSTSHTSHPVFPGEALRLVEPPIMLNTT